MSSPRLSSPALPPTAAMASSASCRVSSAAVAAKASRSGSAVAYLRCPRAMTAAVLSSTLRGSALRNFSGAWATSSPPTRCAAAIASALSLRSVSGPRRTPRISAPEPSSWNEPKAESIALRTPRSGSLINRARNVAAISAAPASFNPSTPARRTRGSVSSSRSRKAAYTIAVPDHGSVFAGGAPSAG